MGETIRVAVVDDADVVRESFRDFLDSLDDIDVVATATNGREIVDLAETTAIDVVVMDVRMPVMSGVEATKRLMALPAPPRVIILTTFNVDKYVELAISYGARGFLLKDCSPADLAQAVRDVAHGGVALSDSAAEPRLLRHPPVHARRPTRRGAVATRVRGPRTHRRRTVQPRDRRTSLRRRDDRQVARPCTADEARLPRPRRARSDRPARMT